MIRVGVLGCAHVHAASYVEALRGGDLGGRAVAVFDHDARRGAAFAGAHGLEVAADAESLCRRVDAVVVAGENVETAAMVEVAAAAGKPVLCEKPLGATVEDCRRLAASAAWLSVAFPVRYAPAVARARHLLAGGAHGRLLAMSGVNHGAFPGGFFGTKAFSGGGAIIDHVVHLADTLRFLTGVEYATVYAEAGRYRDVGDVEDCAQLLATTTGGAHVSIDPSWSRPNGMPGANDFVMSAWFERGKVTIDAFARRAVMIGADGRLRYAAYGEDMNTAMLRDVLSAISEDRPPPVAAEDGAKATALALGALRSSETGRVVDVADLLRA